jgi:DNA-binding NarL/FixJ family response regulator
MAYAAADRASLRILLLSDRPALHAFFSNMSVDPERAPATVAAAREAPLDGICAAVVDVALDPPVGIDVCLELQRGRAELPVAAVVCCPHAVNDWTLQGLLASGVRAVLDLQASAEEAERLLESVGRGASVLHVQLSGNRRRLHEVLSPPGRRTRTEARLLKLVARGRPDHEIAADLQVSRHTVKHRIEQLRHELGVRNRTELAAWAGRHGFYA